MPPLEFAIQHQSPDCAARVGRVTTPHGSFDTPAFMPVGTQAAVKGLLPEQVAVTGSQIILANTYHLMLRPGPELVKRMGGLQKWMRWNGPVLTDSGGYQVFSLGDIRAINDQAVTFKSHLDGSLIELTPERSIRVQNELGADIIMAMDDCPAGSNEEGTEGLRDKGTNGENAGRVREAAERSVRWLARCVAAHERSNEQALFGIVQGGTDLELRAWCAANVTAFDLPGYAIGGVAVGEPPEEIARIVRHTTPLLPPDRPRYLMGVGYERDILAAVRAGVDMFDCVLPTRNGRNANAFTSTGQIRLRNARFAEDPSPIDLSCDCSACAGGFSRSYLRHLFAAGEMLGPILVSLHNVRHFQRFLLDIRRTIIDNSWPLLAQRWPVVAGQAAPA